MKPTVTIAGVDCNDPSGRWAMLNGHAMFGTFAGRSEVNVSVPGTIGSRVLTGAPLESLSWRLAIRFWAVDPETGHRPGNRFDRGRFIHGNMEMFERATRLGAQGSVGHVEIVRRLGPGADERRVGYGRVVSQSAHEWDGYSEYADVEYLFSLPSGRWYGPRIDITKVSLGSLKTTVVAIPAGTAEMDDVQFAVPGAQDHSYHSIWVRNMNDVGFAYWGKTAADKWALIDPLNWKATVSAKSANPNWGTLKRSQMFGRLSPWGPPQGSGLVLYPEANGGVAKMKIRIPSASQIWIRSRKAYYS